MIDLEALADYLRDEHGITEYFHFGEIDRAPRDRHNLYCLAETPGLGLTTEGLFDRPGFQAMSRGAGATTAKNMAEALDRALVLMSVPVQIGGRWVVDRGRFGGGPGYVGRDDRERVVYSANYWTEMSYLEANV